MKLLKFQPPAHPCRESPEHAVGRVLLENLDSLYSTAHRLTGRADLAEDCVQETARKALRASPGLRSDRNIRAWLFTILVNSIRDHFRSPAQSEEAIPEPVWDLETFSLATAHDVRRALAQLSPPQRAAVVLVDLEEFTISEAAQMLKLPPGTVASRLARAHAALRDLLRAYRPGTAQIGGEL
jgi:RNA polymerase sigma-70 factor (ECF subfamily)